MIKIKTITCHEVFNHGASLQEYALLKYLKSIGYDAEVINYQPAYLADNYKMWTVTNPKWRKNLFTKVTYVIAKLPSRIYNLPRYRKFKQFSRKYIPETKKIYTTNEELKRDIPDGNMFICGSDQIWNTLFCNGKDPAFYLDFVPDNLKKISYAASFAVESIEESLEPFVKASVSRLNYVSVREKTGVEILRRVGLQNITRVLDPVFLISKENWINSFVFSKFKKYKYLLVYDFDRNEAIKSTALEYAKTHNLKIYALNSSVSYSDRNYWHIAPDSFLDLIANAELVLSNSFHAVAFSIIFEKNFLAFNRNTNINTRISDLLEELQITDHMVSEHVTSYQMKNINYLSVNPILSELREHSINFLHESLSF